MYVNGHSCILIQYLLIWKGLFMTSVISLSLKCILESIHMQIVKAKPLLEESLLLSMYVLTTYLLKTAIVMQMHPQTFDLPRLLSTYVSRHLGIWFTPPSQMKGDLTQLLLLENCKLFLKKPLFFSLTYLEQLEVTFSQ